MMVFNRNRSEVLTSKCGPSAMSSYPRFCNSSNYHEVSRVRIYVTGRISNNGRGFIDLLNIEFTHLFLRLIFC